MMSLLLQSQDQVFNSSFFHLVQHASLPAKLVLAILLLFSVLSWAIILHKQRMLDRARRQSRDFLALFRRSAHWFDAYSLCQQYSHSPLVPLFLAAYEPLASSLNDGQDRPDMRGLRSLLPIERELRRAALEETARLENYLPWLASIATSAPFIGLFGTVVGIIISFQGLSVQTQTSIQAVAPGIAEALIATAAGLFVAVPAYLGYNYYLARVRKLAALLDEFCLEMLNAIDGSMTEYGVLKS